MSNVQFRVKLQRCKIKSNQKPNRMKLSNRHSILTSMIACAFLAPEKGGATGTAVAPGVESPKPVTDGKAKTAPEAKVHPGLLVKIKAYDEAVSKAESFYIEIIEVIQSEKISKADVVQTMMKARGITFESASSQYSRMKGIWQNPEILQQLKDGTITLRMAREKTVKKQAGTVAAEAAKASGTAATPGSGGDKETKENRYDRCRKAFIASCRECGYDLKSILMSVEADAKAAGIK